MDEYDKKFAEMQKYIPFLEAMIERLKNVKDKSREAQLQKMQSLHGILSNSKRKLKIETLQRCEDVLQKLHNKVEKGNTPGLQFPNKKNEANSAHSSFVLEEPKPQPVVETVEERAIHETPASPSPPVSPDSGSQVEPIIIPTERKVEFDKPASPDPVDTLPTKAPIIIPTERTINDLSLSPSSQRSSTKSVDDSFVEWEMLEGNEIQIARTKNWQAIVTSGHDVTSSMKLVGSNLSQMVNDGRAHVPISIHPARHIPTVPVPSLGGSRRLSSILEKNRLAGGSLDVSSESRPESPMKVSDARLKSPDTEAVYSKHAKNLSPRLKDGPRPSSKPSVPLLLSPPPVSTEPPLSMEDLAELLNEEGDNKSEKKGDKQLKEDAAKLKKDKQELNAVGGGGKDAKQSKPFVLTPEDLESERRWEEVDKHIVKLTSRKCLHSGAAAKGEALKSNEIKGPSTPSLGHTSGSFPTNVSVDNRNRPPSPGPKVEPRFADNYERHPRQLRDKDKPNVHRPLDDDIPNPLHHSAAIKADDRNSLLYQRRQENVGPEMVPPRIDTEFRMEGPEYFNRQVPNQGHWPSMHPPVNTNEFCNNQWPPPPSNFSGMPNSPAQSYQHPMGMHQEMWNVGPGREPIHMEPHQLNEGQLRPNQFPPNMNTGIRPLMSPTARPPDMNHIPRPDEIPPNVDVPNVPNIQPLISPTRFPVGPPYRNFQTENRPYDPSFDRGMEYPHQRQSWDSPVNRPNEVPYRPENEVPCNVIGPADGPTGSYPRPSTPCPWNRDRDRGGGRGRNSYYNERNRGESRNNFNRDSRRPEWARDNHNERDNCNRFGRDARNISDRDPRVRTEHNVINQSPGQPRDNGTSVRDPRLAKDKHFSPAKGKEGSFNERNSRKRSTAPTFTTSSFRKSKEKTKSPPKPSESHARRTEAETSGKQQQTQEKLAKEKMQSPLETLYGVIDTKAKSAQGYCLQNFKIPKIKRNESLESPTSSHVSEETKASEVVDKQMDKSTKKDKEDTTAEVSSSSDGNVQLENWNGSDDITEKKEDPKEESCSATITNDKGDSNIVESDSISTTSSKPVENAEKSNKEDAEPEGPKSKDEVTQEWIEALIRKSFEFGEGKKFVEQAKFMQKLGEVLQAKKLKKIKKIIESESESSSSDKDDTLETKKPRTRKKRRVIVSDSSDEESLAERLGILKAKNKESLKSPSANEPKEEASKNVAEVTVGVTESSELQSSKDETAGQDVSVETQVVIQEKEETKEDTENAVKSVDVPEDPKDSLKDESIEDKENTCKTPKPKAKRRNSLEMLQEDIREMFICEGVVAATGHRLCRTQKENQINLGISSSSQSTPTTRKDECNKRDLDSDTEDTLRASPKPKKSTKSRTSEEFGKLKGKSKKEGQRVTRQRSKQYQSSDSEEDQPLALRTEFIQSVNNQESRNEDNDILRRSRRIVNKESIREPRVVVEKTDISKLDCSKIMFDSSSDESFGIDVSELAAAVDVAESETPEPTDKKKCGQTIKKLPKRKGSESTIDKVDDVQLTDEESIASDVSISSSVASAKKPNVEPPRAESSANEELLSNILVGLVPSKNDAEKDTSVVDKGSDADIDDLLPSELSPELSTKKASAKKKKKKCNWQMGILSKKKRKKATAASSKGDCDSHNTSTELETSIKGNASSVNETNQSISEKDIQDVSVGNTSDNSLKDQKAERSVLTEKDESLNKADVDKEKPSEEKNKELERSLLDFDPKKLIYYAWSGQERYKCLLCFFTGKNIVHHYKLSHPGREILISRLKIEDAKSAIRDATDNDIENKSLKPLTEETCKFKCRICSLFTEGASKIAMEAFYEHCTTHTGEYRFRCNSCPYQAVAKSSMRTHYYKVCRRFKDTFAEAITEDDIPEKNGIYGYLCSKCNYIQLKKCNVEEHLKLWHKDISDVKIIMINMSLDSIQEDPIDETGVPSEQVKQEEPQPASDNLEGSINDTAISVRRNDDDVIDVEMIKDHKVTKTKQKMIEDVNETKSQTDDDSAARSVNDKKKTTPPEDGDSSLPTGNLSVFVCPPELEKKEVEIQLERKRKMQEIIQNIGIKLQKDASKKGLSIIDKLKDKMKTNLATANNEPDTSENLESPNKTPTVSMNSPNPTSGETSINELLPNPVVASVEDSETNLSLPQETSKDVQTENSVSKTNVPRTEQDSQVASEPGQPDSKVGDSSEKKKNDESDMETSDNENTKSSAPIYESDSSSEQSDSEIPADVNMILKETSNIDTSSKDPMLTTIQRLAAQLQATKPLDSSTEKLKSEEPRRSSSLGAISKRANVVPIANIKTFVGKLENKFHEISQETHSDSGPPKNFIRLRRLSGDMLSLPTQSSGVQEDSSSSQNNGSQSSSSPTTEKEEECSFLKIENVVSLAPRTDSDGAENPIINDIRKAVEISPIKSPGVSLLKKSNPSFILKRLNAVTIAQPLSVQPSTTETVKVISVKSLSTSPVSVTTAHRAASFIPIAPKAKKLIAVNNKLPFSLSGNKSTVISSTTTRTVTVGGASQPSNLNYKIVKVVRTPSVLKQNESVNTTMVKLKSMDAYNAMLKRTKLTHLYKCMERDCHYTTDVVAQYHQHYLQHANDAEKKKGPQADYQKCAYCYMVLENWNQMKSHMDEKHAHCRYQCSFCFYRAIVPSYVQVHQATAHPGNHGILLGKLQKELPAKEDINRHDYVHPYVCQHDCNKFFYVPESFVAHLINKHASVLSGFKCHVCRVTCTKIEQLIMHYKTHGFYKYQCLYCLNGSDSITEMHSHLSIFHCNRLPHILERSLPPQPVRNKDVIDQLIVRMFDDTIKLTEEIVDVENDGKDNNKETIIIDVVKSSPSQKKIASLNLATDNINMLDKEENEALNKSIYTLFGMANNSNSSSVSTDSPQTGKTPSHENTNDNATAKILGNLNDVDVSVMSVSNNEAVNKILLDKSVKKTSHLSDRSSIEPIEVPAETFDSPDEFVNINILDNPDFLKNVNSRLSDATNNTTANESKTEDSDIEILDIDDSETTVSKDEKSDSNKTDNRDEKTKMELEENDTKEQLSSDIENSSMSTDTNGNSSSSAAPKTDKPLTLEDIKDTGFIGTKLYRCGYESCDYGAPAAALLRAHAKECPLRSDNKSLTCVHCSKRFLKIGFLLEHLKSHGLKRFGCSLCKMRCTVGYQAMAHMKMKHKYAYSKLVPADPKNPSVDGLFIVQPIYQSGERKGKKRKSIKSTDKEGEKVTTDTEKFSFSPDEIDSLPLQAIYNREVQCAVCPYTTKVRTNIIRHLRLHANDESVPESGPVNPVPCLDKKERMFDKMVNLASSSHQNGRMGGKPKESNKDNEDEFIPKFVPEHKRYVCGVSECNYLTVDEAMLRCHLKALHSEEQYFRCPHCPQPSSGQEGLNIAIDKMAVHLKMHDTRLYKCSHCNYHHYHRHVVERHLTDKHPEKRPFVKVIRELENTENSQQTVQEEAEEGAPDPDGNHWKCNICDYKCVYKAEMVNHSTVTHDEKCQYKCSLCSFKTSGKIMFDQHINSKHPNDSNVEYVLTYQRIKGVNKKSTDNVEQGGQEEPFDTTPLWRRDMPRIRHIRGILLEEEDEGSPESPLKTGKRKSDAELPLAKPAKIKPGKSGSLDDTKQTKEKYKRSLFGDKSSTEMESLSESTATSDKIKDTKVKLMDDNDSNDSDVGRFGPYGNSDGNMYVCTLCTQFKSKYKHDMRDHLFRELNYARWHCKDCGYLSVNRNALLKHFTKHHNGERPNHEPLTPDDDIEEWVGTLLKKQTFMIKEFLSKQNANSTDTLTSTNTTGSDIKPSTGKVSQSSTAKATKTANAVGKSPNSKDSKNQNANVNIDVQDDSSKDNDGLVIDVGDETPNKEKTEKITELDKVGTEDEQGKPLICKHCKMSFTRWRGFKLHVQLTHLKRLGFVCPYCDRSTNSETLMLQHVRSKHPNCPEKLVQNPAAGGPELTDEFWKKEYGIVFPKRSKKRKRKVSGEEVVDHDNSQEQIEAQEKCTSCSFVAMNLTGLKAHMRIHSAKNTVKCTYCTFTASTKAELWDHWKQTHPFSPFKLEDLSGGENESENIKQDKKSFTDDYNDDIEEEHIADLRGDEIDYRCFYCNFRGKTLDVVQNHWSLVHCESKLDGDSPKAKSNYPFRYKEIHSLSEKSSIKVRCSKTETETPYELYLQQSHDDIQIIEASGTKQEGWICQWCNELCDTEVKMKTHHSMFHSHLPLNFKKQDKNKILKGYICPECSFTATFINVMKNHVSKHINLLKCKYCDKTFNSPGQVSAHNAKEHPDMEMKIESIPNFEEQLECIMGKVKWQKLDSSSQITDQKECPMESPKKHDVARKSTTKSTARPNVVPYKIKAVARKSTNPHSRYLLNSKVNDNEQLIKSKGFSYYGLPRVPVNLAKLNTYMVVGGHRMKVNCTTLAQLININPKIILEDLNYDTKNSKPLKRLK